MSEKEIILAILSEIKPTKNLEQVEDIVEGGYLDSFELMSLIGSLSEKFEIEIDVDDISPENFNSVSAIAALVKKLKG